MANDCDLNPKQAAFVREYLIDLNATQAAIRAGYSKKTAYSQGERLLKHAEIKKHIAAASAERAKRTEITSDYVLGTICETVERCRQSYPVLDRKGEQVYVETPEGKHAAAYVFDSKGVLKGCELLGKHLKLFVEKHEHTGKDGGPIETKELSTIELARRAAFLLASVSQEK